MPHLLSYIKIALEISLLWYFIYIALVYIRGTRTEQLLKGVIIIGLIFIVSQQFNLYAINWLLTRIIPISVIALLVIFQPELRRGLARIGQFGVYQEELEVIGEITKAAEELSMRKIGALIALEREVGLKTYIETGVVINGKVTSELLVSLFMPKAPLHDGACIIQHNRVAAAGCLLPLTQEDKGISKSLGTRHRAGIGLSEETDAISIIISEETGGISLSMNGRLTSSIDIQTLAATLKNIFYKNIPKKPGFRFTSRSAQKSR